MMKTLATAGWPLIFLDFKSLVVVLETSLPAENQPVGIDFLKVCMPFWT